MANWRRTLTGVFVTLSLLANSAGPALAAGPPPPRRPIEDAVDLMYAAQGILLAEEEEVDVASTRVGLMAGLSPIPERAQNPAEQILVRLINATKEQIRDTKMACRSAANKLEAEGKDCDLQVLNNECAQQQARLEARLALLRKLRGDRRKALTRAWSSVKRSARSVWHRLGPKGRSFFRAFGRDVVQTVVSGGTLGGGVARTLFVSRARSMARQELRNAAGRLAERVMVGNVKASVAGGDPCAGEAVTAEEAPKTEPPSWPNVLPIDEFGGDESCEGQAWLDEEWPEIEAQLVADRKACQAWPVEQYRTCLEEQAAQGACASDAAAACADLYSAIPKDTLSVSGAKGDTDYTWPVEDMSFSFSAGSASGRIHIEDKHSIDECVYMLDFTLSGSFDYPTCSFKGTGTYSSTARQTASFECMLNKERGDLIEVPITWEATLNAGNVHGLIHRDAGNAFYFDVPVGK